MVRNGFNSEITTVYLSCIVVVVVAPEPMPPPFASQSSIRPARAYTALLRRAYYSVRAVYTLLSISFRTVHSDVRIFNNHSESEDIRFFS